MKHCCELMNINLEDGRVQIFYMPEKRLYFIPVIDQHKVTAKQGLQRCPFCGVKLPKNLHAEYSEILEKEYDLDFYSRDKKQLPVEFKTDAWWKKRGL